jgi:hypothetical protein
MANEACQMSASQNNADPNFVMVPPDRTTESVERLRRQALRLLTESQSEHPGPEPRRMSAAGEETNESAARAPASSMIAGVIAMPAAFLAVVFIAMTVFGKPGEPRPSAAMGPATPDTLSQPVNARAASPTPAAATKSARGVISLVDDARIASIALDGDRVALNVESPAGREILIYDFREGRQIGSAQIETVSADAVDTLSMLTGPPPTAPSRPAAAPAAAVDAAPQAETPVAAAPRLKPRSTP